MWQWQQTEIDSDTSRDRILELCRRGVAAFIDHLNSGGDKNNCIIPVPGSVTSRWKERGGTVHRYQSEIFLQLQGGCTFTLPDRKIELLPGRILIIPPGMPHMEKSNNFGGAPFLNIVLSTYWAESSIHAGISDPKRRPVIAGKRFRLPDTDIYRAMTQALSAWQHDGDNEYIREGGRKLLESLLLKLAADLAVPLPLFPEVAPGHGILAQRLHELLNHDFSACLASVTELAGILNCSPDHLSRSFPRAYGMTISDYTMARRLDHARELLHSSNLSVAEVAEICGFHDRSYFAHRFRQRFGNLPSRIR